MFYFPAKEAFFVVKGVLFDYPEKGKQDFLRIF